MIDRIGEVIKELSSAADLFVKYEVLRNLCTQPGREANLAAADAEFLATFNPANCGHLAEMIRELRDEYLGVVSCRP